MYYAYAWVLRLNDSERLQADFRNTDRVFGGDAVDLGLPTERLRGQEVSRVGSIQVRV